MLLDAMISLFIAGVAIAAVCATVAFTVRYAGLHLERAKQQIEIRNGIAERFIRYNEEE